MGDDNSSLLDDIIANQPLLAKPEPKPEEPAPIAEVTVGHEGRTEVEIEMERRPYAADPDQNIVGLIPGSKFVFSQCGEELDGLWVVAKIEAGDSADPAIRSLLAGRVGGGPPYIRMSEEVLREELNLGRLTLA